MPTRLLPRCMSHRLSRSGAESGMTLVELMVSLVVFAIAATAIVAGLIATMNSTRTSRNRLQASSLAAREMEIVRNEFVATKTGPVTLGAVNQVTNPHPLPGGTAGAALSVDGSPYTVVRNVEWLPAGTGQSACDGGAALTYPSLAVNVSVTWPRMGSVPPVVANTLLTPPKGVLASNLAFVAVKVAGVTNLPMSSQTVTLSGPGGTYTDTTASDGCAVFPLSTPGSYTASLNTAGVYVDPIGETNPKQTFNVALSTLVQKTFSYDQAATLAVTMYTDATYALPTGGVPVGSPKPRISLYNTSILPLGATSVVSSPTITSTGTTVTSVSRLWPYTNGYAIWAGSCKQSDPVAAGGTGVLVPTPPGATPSISLRLAPVAITATTLGLIPIVGATVTATPVSPTTNCLAPDTALTLGVTGSGGVLATSLPVGKWILQVGNLNPTITTGTLLQNTAPTAYAMSVS